MGFFQKFMELSFGTFRIVIDDILAKGDWIMVLCTEPDSGKVAQFRRRVCDRSGMEPRAFNAVSGLDAGQPQCLRNGLVCDDSRIVVTHESDEPFASHVLQNTSWQFHFRIGISGISHVWPLSFVQTQAIDRGIL
jgi:hypothetical protein